MQWVIYIEVKKLLLTKSVDDKRVATTTIIQIEYGGLSALLPLTVAKRLVVLLHSM